jgi:AraC family transcriptional regulator
MLNSTLSIGVTSSKFPGRSPPRGPEYDGTIPPTRLLPYGTGASVSISLDEPSVDNSSPMVDIVPHHAVRRRRMAWNGSNAEFVQTTTHHRVDYSFRSPLHLLAVYEQGMRRDGESYVEGLARSSQRDISNKLTFVPAGHQYREWHDPLTPMAVTYFYFDPAELHIDSDENVADMLFAPRLLFEDATIWSTASKLRRAIEVSGDTSSHYAEALGIVLIHELLRLIRGTPRPEAAIKGGLAGWQQRIVASYIEDHLSEQIPLTTLAHLARLSTFHFCRAFKQSFGAPPHRYHTGRRIERAKVLLAEGEHSVTEVGLTVGFSETSSFTAVFRKITGQTPSGFRRALV